MRSSPDSSSEQLLAFIDAYVVSYEEQGGAVDVLLSASHLPAVAEPIADVRTWRRQRLRQMVRDLDRDGALAVAVNDAVHIAYLATAHATYAALVRDVGLSPASARATLRTIVERSLFCDPPP